MSTTMKLNKNSYVSDEQGWHVLVLVKLEKGRRF